MHKSSSSKDNKKGAVVAVSNPLYRSNSAQHALGSTGTTATTATTSSSQDTQEHQGNKSEVKNPLFGVSGLASPKSKPTTSTTTSPQASPPSSSETAVKNPLYNLPNPLTLKGLNTLSEPKEDASASKDVKKLISPRSLSSNFGLRKGNSSGSYSSSSSSSSNNNNNNTSLSPPNSRHSLPAAISPLVTPSHQQRSSSSKSLFRRTKKAFATGDESEDGSGVDDDEDDELYAKRKRGLSNSTLFRNSTEGLSLLSGSMHSSSSSPELRLEDLQRKEEMDLNDVENILLRSRSTSRDRLSDQNDAFYHSRLVAVMRNRGKIISSNRYNNDEDEDSDSGRDFDYDDETIRGADFSRAREEEIEGEIRIAVLGDSNVGKTSLISTFNQLQQFPSSKHSSTLPSSTSSLPFDITSKVLHS